MKPRDFWDFAFEAFVFIALVTIFGVWGYFIVTSENEDLLKTPSVEIPR